MGGSRKRADNTDRLNSMFEFLDLELEQVFPCSFYSRKALKSLFCRCEAIAIGAVFKAPNKNSTIELMKVTGEGVVQGISYSINGVAFPGGKLGRNNQSCTLSGLQRRGVTFDLGGDAEVIATHADSNSQRGDSNPAASLIPLMQCHPKKLSLTLSASTIEALG